MREQRVALGGKSHLVPCFTFESDDYLSRCSRHKGCAWCAEPPENPQAANRKLCGECAHERGSLSAAAASRLPLSPPQGVRKAANHGEGLGVAGDPLGGAAACVQNRRVGAPAEGMGDGGK